jgi:hypothetical protein
MLFYFRTGDLKLGDGLKEATLTLTAQLKNKAAVQPDKRINDVTLISGSDGVNILRPKKK